MNYGNRTALLFLALLSLAAGAVDAREVSATKSDLPLSPELIELLRSEMRALVAGIQFLPVGISTADWKSVASTGRQIAGSYILEQQISPAQKAELDASLPAHFKRLDADFHQEAEKLEAAAMNHDAQLAAFHYYRLIEACTTCHTLYAPSKFPGFSAAAEPVHAH